VTRAEAGRPDPSRIRAIVTDLDGTITDGERRLDLTAVRWLRRASRHGILVCIATGNVLPIALAIHRSLGLTGPVVAENGGLLYRKEGGVDRVDRLAHRRPALAQFHAVRRSGLPIRRLFTDRWRETEVGLEANVSVRSVRERLTDPRIRAEGTGFAIHLIERTVGKLSTLRRALRPYGLTPEECLIAGDGDNDVEMLRAAGWAVSFSSASARARAAADYVARRRYAEGFVEGLMASGVVSR
jgi:phosphoglycolate phosphatase